MVNKVYVIAGAAGSGKTTVANYLQRQYQMQRVITHTTRPPRSSEQEGVDYHFESEQSMERLHLLEEVEYDHHHYGSSMESLEAGWSTGHDNVIVLDTKGALTYHQKLPHQAIIIFLTVSRLTVLAKRMQLRGDQPSAIDSRLHSREYHRDLNLPNYLKGIAHVIVNDDWTTTKRQIDQLIAQLGK
ncbi:guanylate kinase [Limosilactobacillus frumenti DSM 13145]|uniref:Guanylate kinase n=1 Tax=Limosilactobacillus frumenti DSM 13145 TaxID=1423746 RepID=A0A0R1PGL6_9LACO|nr:AAA family ATPase [Limosilactobacillus frumenti]KRL27979.1 guanylate kinase [Limosilactobacillus frumenti DSM 13145]MBA2913527.1 AAA family ATPase [Limosilactobacillus frumenti]QFG73185.1 AAA family ATPase [Limosilactobacillus frumenti]